MTQEPGFQEEGRQVFVQLLMLSMKIEGKGGTSIKL
jgi:hypothetical protein